jgi:hypothetical protein
MREEEKENVEAGGCEGGRAGGIMSWRCTRQGGKIDKLSERRGEKGER